MIIVTVHCITLTRLQFSEADAHKLFTEAKLRPIERWTDSAAQYSLWLLERPPFSFPLLSHPNSSANKEVSRPSYSASPFAVPSIDDWENMWTLWDFITQRMIPLTMFFQKPIDLRERLIH
jgi:L-histidine Nalpha-methyltransferase / hercynylcysteine S-oxide synthase